jgi:hypothetical protein
MSAGPGPPSLDYRDYAGGRTYRADRPDDGHDRHQQECHESATPHYASSPAEDVQVGRFGLLPRHWHCPTRNAWIPAVVTSTSPAYGCLPSRFCIGSSSDGPKLVSRVVSQRAGGGFVLCRRFPSSDFDVLSRGQRDRRLIWISAVIWERAGWPRAMNVTWSKTVCRLLRLLPVRSGCQLRGQDNVRRSVS